MPRLGRSLTPGQRVRFRRMPALLRLPEECACCRAPSTHRVALGHHGGSLLVGYCDECAEHQASASGRALALGLSSLVLGLAGAAGLPLVLPRLGFLALAALILGITLLPLGFALLPRSFVAAPHAARGPAVRVSERGTVHELCCASPDYAARVAALNGSPGEVESEAGPFRERRGSAWLSAGPLMSVGAAWLSFFAYHPLLRILNLGSARVDVALDGDFLCAVEATSNESPAAGTLVRVPAGEHWLTISSSASSLLATPPTVPATTGTSLDRRALEHVRVDFHGGAVHLFAFSASNTCFWLETTGYGRAQRATVSYAPLPSDEHFWVLPSGIDTWFAENPPAGESASRNSGGVLTALRQAPCSDEPPDVRAGR